MNAAIKQSQNTSLLAKGTHFAVFDAMHYILVNYYLKLCSQQVL